MMSRPLVLVMTLLVGVTACSNDSPPSEAAPKDAAPAIAPAATPAPLVDLDDSLDAVRAEFNAHEHEIRFLTLLSPT